MIKKLFLFICLQFISFNVLASSTNSFPLLDPKVNPHDQASLQRGARWYMNYCSGCHSLNYLRYNRMAKDIGIVDQNGDVDVNLLKDNLIFTGAKITDPIRTAMLASDAKQWFGMAPPDLTLIARVRGVKWLYTYLMCFYEDPSKPFGTNNVLSPDVAMPNVLVNLQGVQIPIYRTKTVIVDGKKEELQEIDHLALIKNGLMTEQQFEASMKDLVNFLAYTAEPMKLQREFIGYFVLGFLVIFAVVAYLLKKEYWKDVNK